MPLPYCTSTLLWLPLMTFFVSPSPCFASSSPPLLVWMEDLSCVAIKGGREAVKAAASSFPPFLLTLSLSPPGMFEATSVCVCAHVWETAYIRPWLENAYAYVCKWQHILGQRVVGILCVLLWLCVYCQWAFSNFDKVSKGWSVCLCVCICTCVHVHLSSGWLVGEAPSLLDSHNPLALSPHPLRLPTLPLPLWELPTPTCLHTLFRTDSLHRTDNEFNANEFGWYQGILPQTHKLCCYCTSSEHITLEFLL